MKTGSGIILIVPHTDSNQEIESSLRTGREIQELG